MMSSLERGMAPGNQGNRKMTRHHTDSFGRHSYKNYSIEAWYNNGRKESGVKSYSIYNKFNSMYDCKDGFKTIEEAVQYIDRYR